MADIQLTSSIRSLAEEEASDDLAALELELSRKLSELRDEAEIYAHPAWEGVTAQVSQMVEFELAQLTDGDPDGFRESRGKVRGLRVLLRLEEKNRKEQTAILDRLEELRGDTT